MSFPRYPKYKPSGVEWLGEVPEHWKVVGLKRLVQKIGSGVTPRGGSEVYVSSGVLFLRSQNVYDEGLRLDEAVFISPDIDEEMSNTRVQPGDILLNVTGASLGRTCQVPDHFEPANVNQHVCIIRLRIAAFRNFVAYAMKSGPVRNQIELAQTGAAREGLNFDQIGCLMLALPPAAEDSQAIAAFLDWETAKIDALVEEQRRLIELLKEKRQAVISHAVTKGLNPHAKMKPSGIEWLGDVPEHWDHLKLKHIASKITDGAHISPETDGGEFYFVSTKDITESGVNFASAVLTSPATYEAMVSSGCKPKKGDVLFSKDGTIGKTVVIRKDLDFVVASSLIIIRPDQHHVYSQFLHYLCQASSITAQVESLIKGAGLPRLSIQNLLKIECLAPPLAEQLEISDFLDRETAKIDALISEAYRAIDLLQERRTALISAAVTGKIDVRGASSRVQ